MYSLDFFLYTEGRGSGEWLKHFLFDNWSKIFLLALRNIPNDLCPKEIPAIIVEGKSVDPSIDLPSIDKVWNKYFVTSNFIRKQNRWNQENNSATTNSNFTFT